LVGGANLILRSGRFNLTAQPLSVGSGGEFAVQINIPAGLTFAATGGAGTIGSDGLIQIDGGTFTSTSTLTINSGGQLALTAVSALCGASPISNSGLINGTGRITSAVTNNAGGIIRADAADHLTLTSFLNVNSGTIQLLGGAIEFTRPLTNNAGGAISGHGSFFSAGLTNNGSLTLVGPDASVFGAATNSATARVLVTAGCNATFFDAVTNQAGSVFKVSDASVAAFLGPVTGLAAFTGNGTTIFESTAMSGPLAAGTTVVDGGASLLATSVRQPALIVRGSAAIAANGTDVATSRVNELVIDGGLSPIGKLDLNNNDLVIDYTGASPLPTVRAQILSARAGGSWTGNGITSSLANASTLALGYADNTVTGLAVFSGQSVDPTSILVKYTYYGDSDLDGDVDVVDLGNLASHWQTSSTWTGGDFDYTGSVDVGDLGLLATNWQAGVGSPLGPSLQEALSSLGLPGVGVPEPAQAGLLLTVVLKCYSRRRRS
jgi:hypothetical protein